MRYYVGWDVGAWHCDKNAKSRDALVVLTNGSAGLEPVGCPFWGNLREKLVKKEGAALVESLLHSCDDRAHPDGAHVVIAVDTPLGWPAATTALLASGATVHVPESSNEDPYLFRHTERLLFSAGLQPLSAVRDMIGSQSLKGIHMVQRLGAVQETPGVWTLRTGAGRVDVIETYPAPVWKRRLRDAQEAGLLSSLEARILSPVLRAAERADVRDALCCAWVAATFATAPDALRAPDSATPPSEGWIWLPRPIYDAGSQL
jgi:predicted nuclease with RNAse H fold